MKNEHELLKEICDTIGYGEMGKNNTFRIGINILYNTDVNKFCKINSIEVPAIKIMDVREIIFTTEFMKSFKEYILSDDGFHIYKKVYRTPEWMFFDENIMKNLDNPTLYLHNLLLGEK